ncbi:putative GIY-YIG nuclease family protein, partial [Vibrio phage 496E54-1]
MVKEEELTKEDVDFSFISKDPRFEDLTGKIFGDLTVLGPYKKESKTLKWVAECSCGNIVKTSRAKLKQRGKFSCVKCAEHRLRFRTLTPVEDKKSALLLARPDLEINSTLGETWADDWEVTCTNCNTTYTRKYRDLIKGVKGCICRNLSRKGLEEKQKVVNSYCSKFNFIFKSFQGSPIRVNMFCEKHKTYMSPCYHNLAKGKLSCRGCRADYYTPYNFGDKESFIEKAIGVHGLGSFDYSEVVYNGAENKVRIRCNKCKTINTQKPAGHLSGRGCKLCSKTGFKPNEPCWVYIIRLSGLCEEWYKVGITNNLSKRISGLSTGSWYELGYIQAKKFDKGWKALNVEKAVLSCLKTKGTINKDYHPKGYTEIFKPEELYLAEEIIDEMYLEENYI